MLQYNTVFEDKEKFESFLKEHTLIDEKRILIQVFTSQSKEDVSEILQTVQELLPQAVVVGSSTAGEILEGKMLEHTTLLSISVFSDVLIKSAYEVQMESYELGASLASKLESRESKCVLLFADGMHINGEKFLKGFESLNHSKALIGGGMSADLFRFEETFCIFGTEVITQGAVGVALFGESLEVHSDYNLGWRAVGPTFRVTKADGNRVYEIENRPIQELYKEALGSEVIDNMPASAIEFPLLKNDGDTVVARTILSVLDDGSILFAGDLHEGDEVRFGIGSRQLVNQEGVLQKRATKYPVDAIFIYSCAARKQFLGKELERNFKVLSQIAPTSGFFTYGEFYFSDRASLLNITTTVMILWEKSTQHKDRRDLPQRVLEGETSTTLTEVALMNLVDYITKELERRNEAIKRAEIRYNEILGAIDRVSIISKTDPNGIITYVNESFERISGYKKEELLGKPHSIVRSPNMPSKIFKEMWATIKKGKIWQGELENRAKDGHLYYVKTSIIPIHDIDGKIIEYLAIREDVTTLVKSKQEVEKRAHFINMILDNEESIVILTKNNRIERINKVFFEVFPYKDFDDFSKEHNCICELFVEKEGYLKRSTNENAWFKPILKEPSKTHLAALIDKNGQERIYSVKSKEIVYDEEITYVLHTFHDITEVELAKEKAQQAEAAQAHFLANMSHEIRTPMNGILGFTELLAKTKLDQTQKKYLDLIKSSTKTLLHIINDILDFSKISSDKLELELLEINLRYELESTFELLRSIAMKKNLHYEMSMDGHLHECLVGDPIRLRQVVSNLLSNAIKFTQKEGSVKLSVEIIAETQQYQTLRISVRDTGIGIPKEKIEKIFQPFAQADSSTTRAFGGTGLGLSISKTLVEKMGGRMHVESEVAKGSCFCFEVEMKKCSPTQSLAKILSGMQIAVVADVEDAALRQRVCEVFDSFGITYILVKVEEISKRVDENSLLFLLPHANEKLDKQRLKNRQIYMVVSKEEECSKEFECIIADEKLSSTLYDILYASMQHYTSSKEMEVFQNIKGRILVAEDYDMNRLLLESLFERYPSLEVKFVRNGQEAVEAVLKEKYDLVLMDVNMPVMNGVDATEIIRKKEKEHTPIVALTANALKGDKERFLQAGMDDYLTKPIDMQQLDTLLKKYIVNTPIYLEKERLEDFSDESSCFENFKEVKLDIHKIADKIAQKLNLPQEVGKKLVHSFHRSLKEAYKEMKEALAEGDYTKMTDLTHKLRGSSGTIHLTEIEALLQQMESVIKENKECDLKQALDIIRQYLEILDKEIDNDT